MDFKIHNPKSENDIIAANREKLRSFILKIDDKNGPNIVTAQEVWDSLPIQYQVLINPMQIAAEAASMGFRLEFIE